jgi:glycosyltransferase involved in cell wall biosynthesis
MPETDIRNGIEKTITKTIENQEIVIGVAMHNNAPTIRRCLLSILNQQGVTRKIKIVLANDNSSDNGQEKITDLLGDSRLTIIHLSNNNAVLTRNAINTYIQEHHPRCVLIGRLDADDEYSSDNELAKIEVIFDTECPDIISAGNYLRENGMIISRTNHTDKRFANIDYLLFRLKQMAECLPEGELPTCNLFIKPDKILPYPSVESGEDHALFVHYLLNKDRYKIHFAENLLPVIYDLGGKATSNNKFSGNYIRCRKELYLNALEYAR